MAKTFFGFKQFRLFSEMTQATLDKLTHMTRMSKVKKHESVCQMGQQASSVYFLMEGWVKVLRADAGGRQITLDILGPGEVFGEECVLGEDTYSSTIVTAQDSLIGTITPVNFTYYLSSYPHLALGFAMLLTARLRKTQQLVADLTGLNVPGRLARLLLTYGATPEGIDRFSGSTRLTHQQMANHIGCSRETVSTVLGQFRAKGLVHFHHHKIASINTPELFRLFEALPNSYGAPDMAPVGRPCTGRLPTSVSARAHRVSLQIRSSLPTRSSISPAIVTTAASA